MTTTMMGDDDLPRPSTQMPDHLRRFQADLAEARALAATSEELSARMIEEIRGRWRRSQAVRNEVRSAGPVRRCNDPGAGRW